MVYSLSSTIYTDVLEKLILVCIYVGLHIKEFAEDGAEKENATAISSPCPVHPSTGT